MKIKVKNYRIGEIASFYGISLDAARLYDKKGILSPVKDTSNNYRSYSREDLVTMQMFPAIGQTIPFTMTLAFGEYGRG